MSGANLREHIAEVAFNEWCQQQGADVVWDGSEISEDDRAIWRAIALKAIAATVSPEQRVVARADLAAVLDELTWEEAMALSPEAKAAFNRLSAALADAAGGGDVDG
jgi:hypothetical protein